MAVVWTLVMCYLLFSPGGDPFKYRWFQGEDKVAHITMFGVWSFLIYAIFSSPKQIRLKDFILIFCISAAVGFATELIQKFVPRRTEDIYDFLADAIGAGFGLIGAYLIKKPLIERENTSNI